MLIGEASRSKSKSCLRCTRPLTTEEGEICDTCLQERENRKAYCIRCGGSLGPDDVEVCDSCVGELVFTEKRRSNLLYFFLFQVMLLAVVYMFLFNGFKFLKAALG